MKNFIYCYLPSILLYTMFIPLVIFLNSNDPLMLVIISIQFISLISIIFIQILLLKKRNILIWFFGFFLIPIAINKRNIAISVFNFIFILFVMYYINSFKIEISDTFYKYTTNDELVNVTLPSDFNDCDKLNFCYDEYRNITLYINNFNKKDFEDSLLNVINNYVDKVSPNYEEFSKVGSPLLLNVGTKKIYTQKYKSKTDNIDHYFIISGIEYENSDIITLSVFVLSKNNYKINKTLLNSILESFELIKKD